jgi:hypothetical protein
MRVAASKNAQRDHGKELGGRKAQSQVLVPQEQSRCSHGAKIMALSSTASDWTRREG